MNFDVLIQNNASKEIFILEGLENASPSTLYLRFNNVELPTGAKDGEYTYAVIYNGRDDVTYETSSVLLDTIVHTDDGDVKLSDLRPLIGLLRVGNIVPQDTFNKSNDDTTYYYE